MVNGKRGGNGYGSRYRTAGSIAVGDGGGRVMLLRVSKIARSNNKKIAKEKEDVVFQSNGAMQAHDRSAKVLGQYYRNRMVYMYTP